MLLPSFFPSLHPPINPSFSTFFLMVVPFPCFYLFFLPSFNLKWSFLPSYLFHGPSVQPFYMLLTFFMPPLLSSLKKSSSLPTVLLLILPFVCWILPSLFFKHFSWILPSCWFILLQHEIHFYLKLFSSKRLRLHRLSKRSNVLMLWVNKCTGFQQLGLIHKTCFNLEAKGDVSAFQREAGGRRRLRQPHQPPPVVGVCSGQSTVVKTTNQPPTVLPAEPTERSGSFQQRRRDRLSTVDKEKNHLEGNCASWQTFPSAALRFSPAENKILQMAWKIQRLRVQLSPVVFLNRAISWKHLDDSQHAGGGNTKVVFHIFCI